MALQGRWAGKSEMTFGHVLSGKLTLFVLAPSLATGIPRALCSGKGKGQQGAISANESSPSPHHRVRTTREERSTRLSCLTSRRSAQAPAPQSRMSSTFHNVLHGIRPLLTHSARLSRHGPPDGVRRLPGQDAPHTCSLHMTRIVHYDNYSAGVPRHL
jgi:hypothetical protein